MARQSKRSISTFLVSALGMLCILKTFTWAVGSRILESKVEVPYLDWAIGVAGFLLVLRIGFVIWKATRNRTPKQEIEPVEHYTSVRVSNDSACSICGKTVSDRVKQYCLDRPQKFSGKIYCYDHQHNA